MKEKIRKHSGSITVDILIAGIVLTAGIAASLYLFRLGYNYLERANTAQLLALKVSQAPAILRTLDLSEGSGTQDLGDGVTLKWSARLLAKSRPERVGETKMLAIHELYLYEVVLEFHHKEMIRTYKVNLFRSKALVSPEDITI